MDLKTLMEKARATNQSRDLDDGLSYAPIDIQLATANEAIRTGISLGNWDCVAEGLDMLETLLDIVREDN